MILKKKIIFFSLVLYLSLIIGFYFGEDSLGAALTDYYSIAEITEKFKDNFLFTLLNYDTLGRRQSPIFSILNSLFFDYSDLFRRLFILHIYLLIPLYFYKCLKIKYKNVPKDYLRLFAGIILLFPTFRSYSIWPDPHLLGTLFFIISIFYYLKTSVDNKPFKNSLLNIFFLSLAAYVSPNFGMFVIYFYYKFYKKFYFSDKIIIITFLNILLSLPFFYYLFYLDINFIFDPKNYGWGLGEKFYSLENISNKIILILSIFLFYLIPFILANYKNIDVELFKSKTKFLISIIIYLLIIYFFDFSHSYQITNSGGGFFYNLSNIIFDNNYLLFLLCFFPYLYLIEKFNIDFGNLVIFLCLILSNPQLTLWQANFSPTMFFALLLLFNGVIDKISINTKTLIISYSYFFIYLAANVIVRNVLI